MPNRCAVVTAVSNAGAPVVVARPIDKTLSPWARPTAPAKALRLMLPSQTKTSLFTCNAAGLK